MPIVLKLRRGTQATMPTLQEGEVAVTTDTHRLYVGTNNGNVLVGDGTFVKVSGDTMTGYLTLANDPVQDLHAATKRYVDNAVSGSITGTKWKEPVRVASTSNINISSPPSSIDGITLSNGDRILLKDQTNAAQNGIYVYNGQGNPLTRASDADTWDELVGAVVVVLEGNINADKLFLCTSDIGGTLGSTPVTIIQLRMFDYIFGNGLQLTGNVVSVKEGTAISVNIDGVNVKYDSSKGLTVSANNNLQVNVDQTKAIDFDSNGRLYLNVDTDIFGFTNGKLTIFVLDGGTW